VNLKKSVTIFFPPPPRKVYHIPCLRFSEKLTCGCSSSKENKKVKEKQDKKKKKKQNKEKNEKQVTTTWA